jgi:hypothetical protein
LKYSIDTKELETFFWAAIGSWLIFLFSSLLLTEAIMQIMHLEILALFYLIIGLVILSLNYLVLTRTLFRSQINIDETNYEVQTFHNLIQSLQRIFWTIIILVTLGLIVGISTFVYMSTKYFITRDVMSLIEFIPFFFLIYLIFMIPSFVGIKEINRLNKFIHHYQTLKLSVGESIIENLEMSQ